MTPEQFYRFNELFNEAYAWYTGRFGMCVNRADVERLYKKIFDEMMDECGTVHTIESVISLYTVYNVLGQLTARTTLETITAQRNILYVPTAKDDHELYLLMKNDPVKVRQEIIKALQVLHINGGTENV